MNINELKKCLFESKMALTEENVLDIFAYLSTGESLDSYPNKEELEAVKKRFKELIRFDIV